jgi:hypothetical protein
VAAFCLGVSIWQVALAKKGAEVVSAGRFEAADLLNQRNPRGLINFSDNR